MKAILGRKMGMTQVFAEDGTMYAVTVVEVLPNVVTQIKTLEKDGYEAIQVGYEDKKESRANKCELGIAKKTNTPCKYHYVELKGDELMNFKVGDILPIDLFKTGDVIDAVGTSKGHGYTGVIKRWNAKIGPKAHGSGYHRQHGSFANNGRCNNRVIPGKKMSGHMGDESATVLNLKIVAVNPEKNYILVKGGLPGPKKSLVVLRSAIKAQLGKPVIIKPIIDRTVVEEELKIEETVTPVVEAPVAETN
ncbi:MAG: 50S ribosomal protein L3 [Erysipelotrichia bacterium]|nr:50S ribosomal protein L3 [Erysipelotrichia bacterium]